MDLDELRDDAKEKPKFELWNEGRSIRYNNRVRGRSPVKGIIRIVEKNDPGTALDLGVGLGIEAEYLIKNGWNVTAVDKEIINKKEIESRLNEEERKKLNFVHSDFNNFEFEKEKYDLVYGINSFSFIDNQLFLPFIEKLSQSLKSEGIFIANIFGPKSDWYKDPNRAKMTFLSVEEARKIFEKFFFMTEKSIKEVNSQEKNFFQNIWIRGIKK